MKPVPEILADFEPQNVLELGDDRGGLAWWESLSHAGLRVHRLPDRERWARQPSNLVSELEELVSLDLVIDHAIDDVTTAVRLFEALFGGLVPGGLYVVDGTLPTAVVLDLMLATVVSPELVDRVDITPSAVVLKRGPFVDVPDRLRLDDITSDPFEIAPR